MSIVATCLLLLFKAALLLLGTYLAALLSDATWSRRWQLLDSLLGTSAYHLLSPAYEAEAIGVETVQPDVYDGGSSDDDEHGHSHEHDHGPRDIILVSQRWALVTGAGVGIGRASVRALSDMGFSLLLVDADDENLALVVAETEKRLERGWRGGVWRKTTEVPAVLKLVCDVTQTGSAIDRIKETVASLPPRSLRLVIHTGTCHPLFTERLTRAVWPVLALSCPSKGERRSGLLFVSPPAASGDAASSAVINNSSARQLRAEAAGLGLGLDVLSVTPVVHANGSPRGVEQTSSRGSGSPEAEDIMRASLLLLSTARSATMTPFLSDALADALADWVPDWMTSRRSSAHQAGKRAATPQSTKEE